MRKNLKELVRSFEGKKLLLLSHRKPDIDSVVSVFVLKELLPSATVAFTPEKDESAKELINFLGLDFIDVNSADVKKFDGIILVDTSSSVLAPWAKDGKVVLLIDHHQSQGRDIRGEVEFIDEKACATSEIIGLLLKESGLLPEISRKAALALCCGIVFDSARFKSARKETFGILAELMERAGESYEKIRSLAEPRKKRDEQIAILRGFQRTEMYEMGGYIIATSNVGSNASDVASFLAEIADVSFVAEFKEKENETRLSARASNDFPLPLNEVLANAAEKIGGKGGGHKKAAGLSAKNKKPSDALKACIETLKEMFS